MEDYLREKHGPKLLKKLDDNEPNQMVWEFLWKAYKANECPAFNRKMDKELKRHLNKNKSWMWLTGAPDKFLRNIENTPENVVAIANWCDNWFKYAKFYGDYAWVVENGPNGDHLHWHCICEMKDSVKHADSLKKSWAKHFPNNQLLTSVDCNSNAYKNGTKRGEYAYKRTDKWEYVQERLDYLENEKKGTHENKSDLGFRGSRGFLTDNI
tara:strand:- start:188 stop:820 length:633 start_codon:yes stop_codon:yes gene_type:complete